MTCNYNTVLDAIKASFYFVYFKNFPDGLLEAAVNQVACTPKAALIEANCPIIYNKYLASADMVLLFDSVGSVDDSGNVTMNDPNPVTQRYLKSRKILDIECTWDEVKQCVTCDRTIRQKARLEAEGWYDICLNSFAPLGGGTNYGGDKLRNSGCQRFNDYL